MAAWARVLDDLDDATAQEIVKVQMQDARALIDRSTTMNDACLAQLVLMIDLRSYCVIRNFSIDEAKLSEAHQTLSAPEDDNRNEEPLSSIPAQDHRQVTVFECASCMEEKSGDEIWSAPCEHTYCDRCLIELFQQSLKDETLYPPRCCKQRIPLDDVRVLLGDELVREHEEQREELEDNNKLYCHVATCSTYISVHDRSAESGMCSECHARSCVKCNLVAHGGECAEDPDLTDVLEAAKDAGWQRCRPCGRILELKQGCYHMTCICRAEFCYLCAEPWKTCACRQWDETNLLARADQVLQRQGGQLPVAAMVEQLRNRHECDPHNTRRVYGGYVCDDCGDELHNFINRCQDCHTDLCNRCLCNT